MLTEKSSTMIFSLFILYLYFDCDYVIQTYVPFLGNNLIVLMWIDK